MTEALAPLAQYGSIGVILIVALLALRSLHDKLLAEQAARIQDAKDARETLLLFQKEILASVDKLSDLYESLKEERRAERDRNPR